MRCDVISKGILRAISNKDICIPIVVRLQGNLQSVFVILPIVIGTNVEEAKKMIKDANVDVFFNDDLEESAIKSIQLAKISELARKANVNISIEQK